MRIVRWFLQEAYWFAAPRHWRLERAVIRLARRAGMTELRAFAPRWVRAVNR